MESTSLAATWLRAVAPLADLPLESKYERIIERLGDVIVGMRHWSQAPVRHIQLCCKQPDQTEPLLHLLQADPRLEGIVIKMKQVRHWGESKARAEIELKLAMKKPAQRPPSPTPAVIDEERNRLCVVGSTGVGTFIVKTPTVVKTKPARNIFSMVV